MFHLTFSSLSTAHPNGPFLCHPLQSHALLQFKSTFTIDNLTLSDACYPKTESWKEGTDCCSSWEGVACDEETGHVIELDLSCSHLVGKIHSNSTLFSPHIAPYLQRLNLAYNNFQGSNMSSQFGVKFGSSLTHLDLSGSGFSGNIPSEISHLTNLVSLYLSFNVGLRVESDRVLESIAHNLTHLRVLYLDFVSMSSVVHASSSLMNLSSSLTSIRLFYCGLEGQFPVSFFLRPNLQELSLQGNNFDPVTSLPDLNSITSSNNRTDLGLTDTDLSSVSIGFLDFVGNLKSLTTLDLDDCSLGGSLLPSFGNLTKLTGLSLSRNNLNGPIPDSFCNLTQLGSLDLGDNHLNGMLPSCLFAMPSLGILRVNDNKLYGQIPTTLFKSDNLICLDLSLNNLRGSFEPRALFGLKKLQYLDFHSNMFQGNLPIPPSTTKFFSVSNNSFTGEISSLICNLTSLEFFDLSHNQFIGLIPPCLGNLSSLLVLNLGNNNLHGTIPNMFVKDGSLNYLNLNGNQFRGRLPHSLSYCKNLEVLNVGNNMIEDVFLRWLEIISTLQVLILRSNKFFGSINGFKSPVSFPNLRILDVSNNNFIGQLPTRLISNFEAMRNLKEGLEYMESEMVRNTTYPYTGFYAYSMIITIKGLETVYEKILKALTIIDFSRNRFEGDIPEVIGKLGALRGLNLSHNLLTGQIPSSFGDLVDLEGLDLSSNKLVGRIPRVLADLTFLAVLNLSCNQLDGPIPRGNQFGTFGIDSYKENPGLCGFPLSKTCGRKEETSPQKNIDFIDSASGFSWKGAFVGYGCGIVFGLLMGYLVFSCRSPKWLVKMVEGKHQYGKVVKRSKQGGHKRRGRRRN